MTSPRSDHISPARPRARRASQAAAGRALALIALLFAAFPAYALIEIAQSTTWRESRELNDDLEVRAGVTLTIDPGVTITVGDRVAPQGPIGITIKGSLTALGTAVSPISFVSAGAQSARGDWGPISFESSTSSGHVATGHLRHVTVQHGSGIQIIGASPRIEHSTFTQNAIAAIRVDLAASPHGAGNTASDNDVDGILVPFGTIQQNVTWGLKGIPYVVQSGVLAIGEGALSVSPASLELSIPDQLTGTATVFLASPAPAAGARVMLTASTLPDDPQIVGIPEHVDVPAGSLDASFDIQALAAGSATVHATQDGDHADLSVVVRGPRTITLHPSATTLTAGESRTITVRLGRSAPTGGLTVALSQSPLLNVPESVTIPAGQTQAPLTVVAGNTLGNVVLTANAIVGGWTAGSADVSVVSKYLQLPANVLVRPNQRREIQIGIHPETSEATTVQLTLENASGGAWSLLRNGTACPSPCDIAVAAGSANEVVEVEASAIGDVRLVASATGHASAQTEIVSRTYSLSFSPSSSASSPLQLPSGLQRNVTLFLNGGGAPPGGLTVTLAPQQLAPQQEPTADVFALDNPGVPLRSIHFAEDQTSKAMRLRALSPDDSVRTIQARADLVSDGILHVRALPVAQLELRVSNAPVTATSSLALGVGMQLPSDMMRVHLRCGAQPCNAPSTMTISLEASPAFWLPQSQLTIPAGTSQSELFDLGALAEGSALLQATALGVTPAIPLALQAVQPQLDLVGLAGARAIGDGRDEFRLELSVPGYIPQGNPRRQRLRAERAFEVDVAQSTAVVGGVFDAASGGALTPLVSIGAGAAESAPRYVGEAQALGSYTVHAESTAGTPEISSTSGVQTVGGVSLRFSSTDVTMRKRMAIRDGLRVELVKVNGDPYVTTGAVEVTVAVTSGESLVAIEDGNAQPAGASRILTIDAGSSFASLPLQALESSETPAQLTASSAIGSAAVRLEVTVEPTEVAFAGLTGNVYGGAIQDDFYIDLVPPPETCTPHGCFTSRFAASSFTVRVTSTPSAAGTLLAAACRSQVTGPFVDLDVQNNSNGAYGCVNSTLASYSLEARVDGELVGTSSVQAIAARELSGPEEEFYLGVGLRAQISLHRTGNDGGEICVSDDDVDVSLTRQSGPDNAVIISTEIAFVDGQCVVNVPIDGLAPTGSQPVTLIASADGYESSSPIVVHVVEPSLTFELLDDQRAPGASEDQFRVDYRIEEGGEVQTAIDDITIPLEVIELDPVGVVAGVRSGSSGAFAQSISVVIAAGQWNNETLEVAPASMLGSYRLRVTLPESRTVDSMLQEVRVPKLVLRQTQSVDDRMLVGAGMRTRIDVQRSGVGPLDSGTCVAPEALVTVRIADTGRAIFENQGSSHQVTIPPGQCSAPIWVHGVAIGSTQLIATASGYQGSGARTLEVVPRLLIIEGLAPARVPMGSRDRIYLRWGIAEADDSETHERVGAASAQLEVVPGTPDPLVAGFSFQEAGGAVSTPVTVPAFASNSSDLYIAAPAQAGSYQLRATEDGDPVTSPAVTVGAPFLASERSEVWLQRGHSRGFYLRRMVGGEIVDDRLPWPSLTLDFDVQRIAVEQSPSSDSSVWISVRGLQTHADPVRLTISDPLLGSVEVDVYVREPELAFMDFEPRRSTVSAPDDFYARWILSGAPDWMWAVAPPELMEVDEVIYRIENASQANVVPGLCIDDCASASAQITVPGVTADQLPVAHVARPAVEGSYVIGASLGQGSDAVEELSPVILVQAPVLHVDGNGETEPQRLFVGLGLMTSELIASLKIGERFVEPAIEIELDVDCAPICSVPGSVTISPVSDGSIPVLGVTLGQGEIDLQVTNPSLPLGAAIPVNVVLPQLRFVQPPTELRVGGVHDLRFEPYVPGHREGASAQAVATQVLVTCEQSGSGAVTVQAPGALRFPQGANHTAPAMMQGATPGEVLLTCTAPNFAPAQITIQVVTP